MDGGANVIILEESSLQNRQELRSGAAPDGTSLWVLSGVAQVWFDVTSSGGLAAESSETFRVLLGPVLAGGARAIATVAPATVDVIDRATFSVQAIEADIDDESGRVQLMFEVSGRIEALAGTTYRTLRIRGVAYHVTIHGTAAA